MKLRPLPVLGAFLLVFLPCASQQTSSPEKSQEKPKEGAAAAEPSKSQAAEKKNPIKATPENLAEARRFFGYDCSMCHGPAGDGKGDLAASMGLKMSDWREGSSLSAMSDAEMFDIIVKGKGKMTGEGDRISPEMAWKLVNYVRSLAKKEGSIAPQTGTPQ